ncbi:CYFA0S02e10462g1_1 [Cyberlindnera fabianii]|uniref:Acyl-coenzyme A diphosphatase SCS3 n=1 Tax=Cyberlindnera fabianii TaxID=36022 RepID=A0A061APF1_CYBFA|nr:CYFA0S02e10462g1_1 [Cyberlindnera fabianii]
MDRVYQRHHQRVTTFLQSINTRTRLQEAELVILLSYPFTILLGQLLHHTSPEIVVNYYTNKHNVLNQLFVKKGWFWTVLLTVYFLIQHNRINIASLSRLALGTAWWYLFTQWCFGLPIMDRVFVMTGGVCKYDTLKYHTVELLGSSTCRKMRGIWSGGHDPSGHVFLLVLSSLIMWFELVDHGVYGELQRFVADVQRLRQRRDGNLLVNLLLLVLKNSSILLMALQTLWWWMLLVTSNHFHSFAEKLTGLIAGYIGLLIYMIPRFL